MKFDKGTSRVLLLPSATIVEVVLIILIIFKSFSDSVGIEKESSKSYSDILNSKIIKSGGELGFDVSNWPINEIGRRERDFITLPTYISLVYYRQSKIGSYRESCKTANAGNKVSGHKRGKQPMLKSQFPYDGYLLNVRNTVQNHSIPAKPKVWESFLNDANRNKDNPLTVIFSEDECIDSAKNSIVKTIKTFKSKWKNIKVGYETSSTNETHNIIQSSFLSLLDVIIYSKEISPPSSILSYFQFKRMIREEILPNNNNKTGCLVHASACNTCEIYVRLNLPHPFGMTDEIYAKYFYFLLQFSVFWINEGNRENIILPSFEGKEEQRRPFISGSKLRSLIIPQIAKNINERNACFIEAYLKQVLTTFDSISVIGKDFLKKVNSNDYKCLSNKHRQSCIDDVTSEPYNLVCKRLQKATNVNSGFPQLYHGLHWDSSSFSAEITYLKDNSIDFPLHEVFILQGGGGSKLKNSTVFQNGIKKLRSNVIIGCSIIITNSIETLSTDLILKEVEKECKFMWSSSSSTAQTLNEIIFSMTFQLENADNFGEDLWKVYKLVNESKQMFPGKRAAVSVQISEILKRPKSVVTLFCDDAQLETNEKVESIINFARVHEIPLTFKQNPKYYHHYLNDDHHVGWWWWSVLKTIPELDKVTAQFPVFVARNYPNHQIFEDFNTNQCISWNDESPTTPEEEKEIQFDTDFCGTTLYIQQQQINFTLSKKGLENMLKLALNKFPLIEIIPVTFSDLQLLIDALSLFDKNFIKELSNPVKMYLKLEWSFVERGQESIFKRISEMPTKFTGIHFPFANITTAGKFQSSFQNLKKYNWKMGLSVENCIANAENYFERLASVEWTDYILCNNEHKLERKFYLNKLDMEKFLDTHLFIQKFYHRLFPKENRDIFFRLNTAPQSFGVGERGITETRIAGNFLKAFSKVADYADAYKLKFFMFPAFDSADGKQFGWWKVDNNVEKLEEESSFIEREAAYLEKVKWNNNLLQSPKRSESISSSISPGSIVGLIFLTVILAAGVAVPLVIWYKRKSSISKKEMRKFLGRSYISMTEMAGTVFPSLELPDDYKIPKRNILLLNIIGHGSYGLVYNANLSLPNDNGSSKRTVSAAVKMPLPGCPRDMIRSMLTEVKTLCHVGVHQHVLRFIGAHIEDVGRGEIFVVYELYKNGTLLEHLKKLLLSPNSRQSVGDGGGHRGDLRDLPRFCREIALGMEYLGSQRIVHNDLAARNIMLDSTFCCKIGDFVLSKKLEEGEDCYVLTERMLPLPWKWMAVESLGQAQFSFKSDIWSYGITLWEVYSLGSVPYSETTWSDGFVKMLENGYVLPSPKHCTVDIYEKMKSCWNIQPENRPTFSDLAQFFVNLINLDYIDLSGD